MLRNPYRRAFTAYLAGVAAIGALMAIVALGGNAVAPKQMAGFSPAPLAQGE